LFDGHFDSSLASYICEQFPAIFSTELLRDESPSKALKRTFQQLSMNANRSDYKTANTSGIVVFVNQTDLTVANVGDALAVLCRDGKPLVLSLNHSVQSLISSLPSELDRVRSCGGCLTRNLQLEGEVSTTKAFGLTRHLPIVNSDPHIKTVSFKAKDEYIIIGNHYLWNYVKYQSAVEIIKNVDDPQRAALKLRDMAINYGATGNVLVMVISLRDVTTPAGQDFIDEPISRQTTSLQPWAFARQPSEAPSGIAAPVGRVVLVFTDIKSSTMLWEKDAQAMHDAVAIHNQIMREQLRVTNGYEVKTEGDAFMVAFWDVIEAVAWCITVQWLLLKEPRWPAVILESSVGKEEKNSEGELLYRGLSVRMGVHIGTPVCEPDPTTNRMDYLGPVANRAARISSVADGGEIFISSEAMEEVNRRMSELSDRGVEVFQVDCGEYSLKGLGSPEALYVIYPGALKGREAYRKKNEDREDDKVGLIRYIKLPPSEPQSERWNCERLIQDIGRETTRKGKLTLTPNYVCFISKLKGSFLKKDKEVLAVQLSDIKEIKKIETFKFGPTLEIISLDGSKMVLVDLKVDEALKKIEAHKKIWLSDDGSLKVRNPSSVDMLKIDHNRKISEDLTKKKS